MDTRIEEGEKMKWQPIETAPKDRRILLSNAEEIWIGEYREFFTSGATPRHPWRSLMIIHINPTPINWMELPSKEILK